MWTLLQREGVNIMFKRIDHVEIVTKNAEKSIEFYVDILGFRIKSKNEMKMPPMKEIIFLELGDTMVEIISVDDPKPKSEVPWEVGYRGIALEVENMTTAIDFLRSKGVIIPLEPFDLGNSYRGEIRDPDGLIIELREWK